MTVATHRSGPAGADDPASQAGSLQPGSILAGRYEILEVLGQGGMGAVYKARDREVDRIVALKAIRPELAANREMLERFKKELVLARQITHLNIVRIYDLGVAGPMKFITMEFIEGQDLGTVLIRRGKLECREAAGIMLQVARALEAAHAQGVIHRDLKPQNVMLGAAGRAAVMDFGIAQGDSTAAGGANPTLTQAGALLGTPRYMSPEQARCERVDARSDIFSAGLIFYELITGQTPHDAPIAQATLVRRATEAVRPPVKLDPSIPKRLSDIVARCLELDPARRYQSAGALARDLDEYLSPPVSAGRSRNWIWAVAAVIALAAAGAFAILRKPDRATAPVLPAAPPAAAVQTPPVENPAKQPPALPPVADEKRPAPPPPAPAPKVADQLAHARELRDAGKVTEAAKAYQAVLKRAGALSDQEQHQARGEYYLLQHDPLALPEFQALDRRTPDNPAILGSLAEAYLDAGDFSRALDAARRALKADPENLKLKTQVALDALYAGDFENALKDSRELVQSNPAFEPGYVAQAIVSLSRNANSMATTLDKRLVTISRDGKSASAEGLADLALFAGHFQEARSILEPAVAEDLANHDARAARKMAMLAQTEVAASNLPQARVWADRASDASTDESVLEPAAEVYIAAGNDAKALALAQRLSGQPSAVRRAYGLIVQGLVKLRQGDAPGAISLIQSSQQLAPTWLADFELGRAYLENHQWVKADQQFIGVNQKRHLAVDLFQRQWPTARYIPPVVFYVARARDLRQFPAAGVLYKRFLSMKQSSEADPQVELAKQREAALGQ
ncbi:MAG TPA: protein kinase [Bryobacteraceae bacterium]|nr:protein kinase [Bryobacteraceae bacterium]